MNKLEHVAELVANLMASFPGKNPHHVVVFVKELLRIATRLHSLNEAACNYELSERQKTMADNLDLRVRGLCEEFGIEFVANGDPRGCPIKLKMPNGASNSFDRLFGVWGRN